jgi:hypothetical protein
LQPYSLFFFPHSSIIISDESLYSQTQANSHKPKSPTDWPNNIVSWDGPNDPKNPMKSTVKKKMSIKILLGFPTMNTSFASSSFLPTFDAVSAQFGVSTMVTTVSLSLLVLGFACGLLVSALGSESDGDFSLQHVEIFGLGKSIRFAVYLHVRNCMTCALQPAQSLQLKETFATGAVHQISNLTKDIDFTY